MSTTDSPPSKPRERQSRGDASWSTMLIVRAPFDRRRYVACCRRESHVGQDDHLPAQRHEGEPDPLPTIANLVGEESVHAEIGKPFSARRCPSGWTP